METGRAARKAQTCEAIKTQARRLFIAHGYEAVTIRWIASAAGRTTGAIFAHFEDKADLYRQAMDAEVPDLPAFVAFVAGLHLTERADPAFKEVVRQALSLHERAGGQAK